MRGTKVQKANKRGAPRYARNLFQDEARVTHVETERDSIASELAEACQRIVELERELRTILKWAKRMGYRDIEARVSKLLGET